MHPYYTTFCLFLQEGSKTQFLMGSFYISLFLVKGYTLCKKRREISKEKFPHKSYKLFKNLSVRRSASKMCSVE